MRNHCNYYLFLLLTLFAVSFYNCKKDNTHPPDEVNLISLETNGVKTVFNYQVEAVLKHDNVLQVNGYVNGQGPYPVPNIEFSVEDSSKITTTSYILNSGPSLYPLIGLSYTFRLDTNINTIAHPVFNSPNPLTITVNEITSTRIKGTFFGELQYSNGIGISTLLVTNGIFNVSYQKVL